jgi:cysteine desulfuration protein SufE
MYYETLDQVYDDFEILDRDDRWGLIIDLGKELEEMPDALKTDATKVRGCSSDVWAYPVPTSTDQRLHFLADSTSGLTKGIIALILKAVQDRSAAEILATDIEGTLRRFNLEKQFTSNRTQGVPNMIALIRQTAERLNAKA